MKCTFIWLILPRFLLSSFYSYYFFELAQNRPYSLSKFKRVTFDFIFFMQELHSGVWKLWKFYLLILCPHCELSFIYFFSFFFFLELQSCLSMTVFLGVNVCWYLYRWLLKVWKKGCMQCQWCLAVVTILNRLRYLPFILKYLWRQF